MKPKVLDLCPIARAPPFGFRPRIGEGVSLAPDVLAPRAPTEIDEDELGMVGFERFQQGRDGGGDRRGDERRRRLLLSQHRQGDVFRRAAGQARSDAGRGRIGACDCGSLQHLLLCFAGAAGQRCNVCGKIAVLGA